MSIKIGVLDQSPIYAGETAADALRHTIELVRRVEELGYERFWVSEHHDSEKLAGSSPEVLISHLLAHTKRISIGSGGVMLQHYSPYKVAENFNVLASLAPGRVDLGIGRAPGGLPRSTQALQRGIENTSTLEEKIAEVRQFIHHDLPAEDPLYGIQASPIPDIPADIYVLGTSVESAGIAAGQGLPYVFSQFINGSEQAALDAFNVYRTKFNYSNGSVPRTLFALSVIVAETAEEAALLAGEQKLYRIHLDSGRILTVGTLEQAEEFGKQAEGGYRIEIAEAQITKGTKEDIKSELTSIVETYKVDELIVTTALQSFAKRIRSFELLHEALAEMSVHA